MLMFIGWLIGVSVGTFAIATVARCKVLANRIDDLESELSRVRRTLDVEPLLRFQYWQTGGDDDGRS